ncbi:MAG: hypothetical protein AAGC91_12155, partial [Pseudomonadota bacterium]
EARETLKRQSHGHVANGTNGSKKVWHSSEMYRVLLPERASPISASGGSGTRCTVEAMKIFLKERLKSR